MCAGWAGSGIDSGASFGDICVGVSEIPRVECNALVALYRATEGDGWIDHQWLHSNTPCQDWSGVVCENGNVTGIDLNSAWMTGTLPYDLVELTHLKRLSLSDNNLKGVVPAWLSELRNLEYLDLSLNFLSGFIPSTLSKLSRLTMLDLGDNRLGGSIPGVWEI